mmetsp:Transcript_82618/g.231020  ORF Transcript_82618/g.231020 Transcript_82618/m.231020 type:complete len:251 (-) Transcript_82618:290-1042(-)
MHRGGKALLPVHRARPLIWLDAPGPLDPVHDDQVAPGGFRRAARDPNDGRREVLVEGVLRREDRRQPDALQGPHHRECQRHHRLRLQQEQDVHLLRSGLRRPHVSEHRQDLEGGHVQHRSRRLRIRRGVEHRPVRVPGDTGGALLPVVLPGAAAREQHHGLPHPLRHRPGSVLQSDAGHRAQVDACRPPAGWQARAAALQVLPAPAGGEGKDVGVRRDVGDLPHRHARADRDQDYEVRVLGRQGHREGAA